MALTTSRPRATPGTRQTALPRRVGSRQLARFPLLRVLLTTVLVPACNADAPLSPIGAGHAVRTFAQTMSCSYGDAVSLFQTAEVANEILWRRGPEQPRAESLIGCQYRFYWENGHPLLGDVIFSEEDHFLGGIIEFLPYKQLGLEREAAIDIIDAISVRTWLAPVTNGVVGTLIEQPLMTSAFRDVMTAEYGLVVGRHWGFIAQLPPGEYASVTDLSRPLFFEDSYRFTVRLVIVSAS